MAAAKKLRAEADELTRIGRTLSLQSAQARFLADAQELRARADRIEATIQAAEADGSGQQGALPPPSVRTQQQVQQQQQAQQAPSSPEDDPET